MSQRIIECVPNFSEGRDKAVIRQITAAIEASGGVKLLDVDPGEATNRTVVTFVGEPEAVVEAAFAGVKRAAELIDMRRHKGAHPRMGATDVLPLIPIAGVTLAECAELARALARRIADELRIPTYCYEAAAFAPERKNLAVCRAGEYEALPEKLAHTASAPDFGARPFDEGVARTGATTVGARDFLIAVNFNLNTTSLKKWNFRAEERQRPDIQLRRMCWTSWHRIIRSYQKYWNTDSLRSLSLRMQTGWRGTFRKMEGSMESSIRQ